eukprot:4574836-Pleurochrysis_carterae.AAC.1
MPQSPPPSAFDANLLFERRTESLLRKRVRVPGSCRLRKEAVAWFKLHAFWGVVWAFKVTLCRLVLMPALIDSHDALSESFPSLDVAASNPEEGWRTWGQPAHLVRMMLNLILWAVGGTIYIADTWMWYQVNSRGSHLGGLLHTLYVKLMYCM